MTNITPDNVKGAARGDWKSIVSLLLAALAFAIMLTWGITGYVLRGADTTMRSNTEKIIGLESRQTLYDSQVKALDARQNEVLAEIKAVSNKLNTVSESQARMEGIVMTLKK